MSLYRLKAKGGYSNKSNSEIDDLRDELIGEYEDNSISGTFTLGEGENWIDIEGDQGDLITAYNELKAHSFFDYTQAQSFDEILERRLEYMYIYHEDRMPVSDKP